MKVAIVGSRGFTDLSRVRDYVLDTVGIEAVISGGARGVDREAELTAETAQLKVVSFRPFQADATTYRIIKHELFPGVESRGSGMPGHWSTFGQAAFARNTMIVEEADRVVAFWDEVSSGTYDSIVKTIDAGKPLEVFTP